jgi:hypothetical protein
MAERRYDDDPAPVDYIDCEIPRDMTLREWRGCERPRHRSSRLRPPAGAVARAARLRRRA